ncbi:aldehyde dehydrogenase [Spirochaeta africana]|uniref:Aldehyde dehydrogenase n=1 Tax=Spirochaeta africana (strain ATCC 700263 / DSM 8902 / Z-7692) TaxID=889378 RepID=H9UM33_SPIAZ|nr:aldehyde dehydrogenase [Spirochaeta africana]AFG38576.1 NAD-dependent aldehyde dehydrogenase [Spirochaeta africana DSM 8902]
MPEIPETPVETIELLRSRQREYYTSGATRSITFRRRMLKRLLEGIKQEEQAFIQALQLDLGKSAFEAYANEMGIVYREIRHARRHVARWARRTSLLPDFYLLPGRGRIVPEPYGSALILAPWNYPMQLLFAPLVAALAAGNTAVIKPSELAPHTAAVSQRVIESCFPPEYVTVAQGGPEVSQHLIRQGFDYLFFTGSVPVGRIIMQHAAEHLTPVTLELGGKSPAVVDASADLDLAARKIVWGKYNNAGQTCVAPDYVLAERSIADQLVERMRSTITGFYGEDPAVSPNYGRIINRRHFDRLAALLDAAPIIQGGNTNPDERYIEPTIMYPADWESAVMQDEIFGPLLPVIPFDTLNDAIARIRERDRPLALYAFTRSALAQRRLTEEISFGGGGINCTIMHVASTKLPFGGVGSSGMGAYHGRAGFETFSHRKSILQQPARFDIPIAYPGKQISMRLLRRILR